MILAAGGGRRLAPLTFGRAKPSLPVLGTPLVVIAANLLRSSGIREIVVNLHHHGSSVRRVLEERLADPRPSHSLAGTTFSYSSEETLLGTGGGIGRVRDWLAADGTAVVVNSDFLSDIDLPAAIDGHRSSGASGTLVVVEPNGPFPGEMWIDGKRRVVSVGAPPASGEGIAGPLEFTGLQILEPRLLAGFADSPCDSIRDIYPESIRQRSLLGWLHPGWWWEFGSLDRFLEGHIRLARAWREGRRAGNPPSGAVLASEAGSFHETPEGAVVWLGPGAEVSPRARVRGVVVLGAGARVREDAEVEDSVLLDRVLVPPACRLVRCLVAPETVLTGGATHTGVAIASAPCGAPAGLAGSPEKGAGRPAPPHECAAEGDLWLRRL